MLRAFGDTRMPIALAYADVYLWRNKADRKYFITMVNRLNPQDPNSPAHLEIKLLYGGAVHDQRYIVSVPPGLADRQAWYTVLRYNMTGRDNRLNRERRVWHDYKFYMWWSAGADGRYGTAGRRADGAAGQHQRRADDVRGLSPHGVAALSGQGHGPVPRAGRQRSRRRDQHRRRSRSSTRSTSAARAVTVPGRSTSPTAGDPASSSTPRYLSAERSSVVCGRCHDRRQGYGGPTNGYTQAISETGELAPPGISRQELITRYTDPVKKGPTMRGPGREDNIWADDIHSNKPHQQYADFLKSKMYRNDRVLVACSDCHDLHGGKPYPAGAHARRQRPRLRAVSALSHGGRARPHGHAS